MAIAPPAVFTGAHAAAFAFHHDGDAVQALVDKLLTPGGGGLVRYKPLGGLAVVSFMRIARCASPRRNGWAPGRECAVWLPLLEFRQGRPLPRPVLWAPYVFIDYSIGLVTGREVWGWPKAHGTILAPGEAGQSDFSCATMIFRDTDRDDEGRVERLLTVVNTGSVVADPNLNGDIAASRFSDLLLRGEPRAAEVGGFGAVVPAIALKQFPDSNRPSEACFQAIVNSPCRMTAFHRGGSFGGDPTLLIANCKSHGIAVDILAAPVAVSGHTTVGIAWSAWFEFDFEALPASAVAP
ncbi:acetoacetate decarboxylase family protein [Caulobacter segnis]|uniref:acetoacetate decarboxylase family protein n=1 Tax=Caulobacter segnis TaxID=88688 RepID=UPI00285F059C|nr:acetoacetate decarboxylase family protein [Caulobacter segnis]MDR6624315.1 hypothetical protein [Caulobacter segnis]